MTMQLRIVVASMECFGLFAFKFESLKLAINDLVLVGDIQTVN